MYFKSGINENKEELLSPELIKGFGFKKDDVHYESVKAEIRKDTLAFSSPRFARLILRGYTNLYKLQVPEGERRVIFNPDNTFVFIIRKENQDYTLGQYEYWTNNQVSVNKRYMGILNIIANDCDKDLKSQIANISFTEKDFSNFIERYNECKSPEVKSEKFNAKIKSTLSHGVEASFNTYLTPDNTLLSNGKGFPLGYFWTLNNPEISRKYATYFGINYLSLDFNFSHESKILQQVIRVPAKMQIIRVPVSLQRNFVYSPNQLFKPFFNLGLSGAFIIKNEIDNSKFYPYFNIGIGANIKSIRFGALIENEGVSLNGPKIIKFSLGYTLKRT
ncbi:hypothetical protein [Adhaeribacter aquaticus]|uniref:hypothetical protein n=1 Tax=Adhaeribacter aquaticus TaxID=299567 RepID=UPI00041F1F24|nr:hypothetical protein [Adhaeribacter aquaticus]